MTHLTSIAAYDCETDPIRPGLQSPPMACLSFVYADYRTHEVFRRSLVDPAEGLSLFRGWVSDPGCLIVGANTPYDLGICANEAPDLLPAIFDACQADRVTDVQTRQKLLDIAAGRYRGYLADDNKWIPQNYNLGDLTYRNTGRRLKKEVEIRIPDECRPFEHAPEYVQYLHHAVADGWYVKKGKAGWASYGSQRPADPLAVWKDAGWYCIVRLSYGLLRRIPMSKWPQVARAYAMEDAEATFDNFVVQEKHRDPYLRDEYRQQRHFWWKHLMRGWGLRTAPEAVAHLEFETLKKRDVVQTRLVAAGLVDHTGKRNTKPAAEAMIAATRRKQVAMMAELTGRGVAHEGAAEIVAARVPLRRTATFDPKRHSDEECISLDEDACKAIGDPLLLDYAEYTTLGTIVSKDIPALRLGSVHPIHSRFDIADTGRSTSSGPNVMNWRRLPGIRECFVPRKGFVFAQADYEQLELFTLAQACLTLFGKSELARVLNDGKDPHLALAAEILGMSYEEAEKAYKIEKGIKLPEGTTQEESARLKPVSAARDTAKVGNFGIPGGLGAKRLVHFAWSSYKVKLHEDPDKAEGVAKELKARWMRRWPEMTDYFAYIARICEADPINGGRIEQLFTGRIRGGCSYTAACNTIFQGLGADVAHRAGWLISRGCYVDPTSPLFGSRIVNFIHDEFILETPDRPEAHESAQELERLMLQGAKQLLPDMIPRAPPILMRYWSKEAKAKYNENGRLVPWPE